MKIVKNILIAVFALIILYWIIFVSIPTSSITKETYQKIDSLNNNIDSLEKNNKILDSTLIGYTNQISDIDKSIDHIKNEKTTIKEIYHETITNVDHYDNSQLDSFFTNRYYPNN
jgi:peptidoglycan hydrolase CwlO-like protein